MKAYTLVRATAGIVGLGLGVLMLWSDGMPLDSTLPSTPTAAIPIAVIGDSGSHSYQDRITFSAESRERGGDLRARTLQWTEVLARLRGNEIDLGPWVVWGRPGLVAWGRELLGLPGGRAPKKEDFLYNFANSGAACKNIMGARLGQRYRQAPRLVALMDGHPEQWRGGVVVIAIGANDWYGFLELQSRNPSAPELHRAIAYCKEQISAAIALIHASHPSTRVLLVGLGNEADDPMNFDRFRNPVAMANIKRALSNANDELRQLATADPKRIFYADYNAWFVERWGERGPEGEPAYKTLAIGPKLRISNTAGDEPNNALLSDHHGGLAFNALWAQWLVGCLRDAFGLPLTPITDDEISRLAAG